MGSQSTDRQTFRYSQMLLILENIIMGSQSGRQTDKQTFRYSQTDRQTARETDRLLEIQTDRQTARRVDRRVADWMDKWSEVNDGPTETRIDMLIYSGGDQYPTCLIFALTSLLLEA